MLLIKLELKACSSTRNIWNSYEEQCKKDPKESHKPATAINLIDRYTGK